MLLLLLLLVHLEIAYTAREHNPLNLKASLPHAPAGVEGPPHHRPPPWPRQPRAPCPPLPPTPYYFYITVLL